MDPDISIAFSGEIYVYETYIHVLHQWSLKWWLTYKIRAYTYLLSLHFGQLFPNLFN
jgi:hypothetical protein